MSGTLTDKNYWNKIWKKTSFKKLSENEEKSWNKILMNIPLPKGNNYKFIELGCAGSGKMIEYFYRNFGYEIYGIDISDEGLKNLENILNDLNIPNNLILSDLLNEEELKRFENYFDVVFSNGLIEHFKGKDFYKIVESHFKIAKDDGYVIITVPNFESPIYKLLGTVFSPRTTYLHHNLKVCNLNFLKNLLGKFGEIKFAGYRGIGFNPNVVCGFESINRILIKINKFNYVKNNEKLFYPHIVIIIQKKI